MVVYLPVTNEIVLCEPGFEFKDELGKLYLTYKFDGSDSFKLHKSYILGEL